MKDKFNKIAQLVTLCRSNRASFTLNGQEQLALQQILQETIQLCTDVENGLLVVVPAVDPPVEKTSD